MTTTIDNPTTTTTTATPTATIPIDGIRSLIAGAHAASTDKRRPTLAQVMVTVTDSTVHTVCTDTYRLNLTAVAATDCEPTVEAVAVPAKEWVTALKSSIKPYAILGAVPVTFGDRLVTVGRTDLGSTTIPLPDHGGPSFPNWQQLIPGDGLQWYGDGTGATEWPTFDRLAWYGAEGPICFNGDYLAQASTAMSNLASGRKPPARIYFGTDKSKPAVVAWKATSDTDNSRAGLTLLMPVRT